MTWQGVKGKIWSRRRTPRKNGPGPEVERSPGSVSLIFPSSEGNLTCKQPVKSSSCVSNIQKVRVVTSPRGPFTQTRSAWWQFAVTSEAPTPPLLVSWILDIRNTRISSSSPRRWQLNFQVRFPVKENKPSHIFHRRLCFLSLLLTMQLRHLWVLILRSLACRCVLWIWQQCILEHSGISL